MARLYVFLCVFLPCPFPKICQKLRRVILEEIEMHGFGDSQYQIAVEGGFVEDFVDIVAGAMDFTRQPTHAAVVGLQLLVDEVPDVDVAFVGFHCLGLVSALPRFPVLATK